MCSSDLEMEIMRLVARGENLSQVAHALGVSYKTVANSCALIKAKLGVRTTADLVRIGVEHKLA